MKRRNIGLIEPKPKKIGVIWEEIKIFRTMPSKRSKDLSKMKTIIRKRTKKYNAKKRIPFFYIFDFTS